MEYWKPYKYIYEVSNMGRIRNSKTHKILKPRKNSKGYLIYSGSGGKRGIYINIIIHRAVAELFIPNPNNLPQVNHIDGNKEHNYVTNLEWCTGSYNQKHAFNIGLKTPIKNYKLSEEEIEQIMKYRGVLSSRKVANKFNVCHKTILNYWNR